jgi:peptidoglycan/xylan/chitin deacetylase (PgdA/CDA1 family)
MLKLSGLFKKSTGPHAVILMYHRIAQPISDVWDTAVSPQHFEQHLQHLQKSGNVVPLSLITDSIYAGQLNGNNIAITFDDGYADNFTTAMPLLEQYGLPATFFITAGNHKNTKEYWWDELERTILFTERLPQRFLMSISNGDVDFNIKNEVDLTPKIRASHCAWHAAVQPPPTQRALLYYHLWSKLKLLSYDEQCLVLNKIKKWAKFDIEKNDENKIMSVNELKKLSENNLFTIGAHTATHAALGHHEPDLQKSELTENIDFLQQITGSRIDLVAYPYGSYNGNTLMLAYELGLHGGFTTEEEPVHLPISPFKIGRFQVKDMNGTRFRRQLASWRH